MNQVGLLSKTDHLMMENREGYQIKIPFVNHSGWLLLSKVRPKMVFLSDMRLKKDADLYAEETVQCTEYLC